MQQSGVIDRHASCVIVLHVDIHPEKKLFRRRAFLATLEQRREATRQRVRGLDCSKTYVDHKKETLPFGEKMLSAVNVFLPTPPSSQGNEVDRSN